MRGAVAVQIASVWEALGAVAEVRDPARAAGDALDAILAASGVAPRLAATRTAVTLEVEGDPAQVVAPGFRARAPDRSVIVEAASGFEIPASGVASVPFRALEAGPLVAAPGTVTEIETPRRGVRAVRQIERASPGRARETDAEARARRLRSLGAVDAGSDRALLAAILAVPEVEDALVLSNRSGLTAADGTPPHAVRVIVHPGLGDPGVDARIARAIWSAAPAGIRVWGTSVSALVTDASGTEQAVTWDESVEREVWARVSLVTDARAGLGVRGGGARRRRRLRQLALGRRAPASAGRAVRARPDPRGARRDRALRPPPGPDDRRRRAARARRGRARDPRPRGGLVTEYVPDHADRAEALIPSHWRGALRPLARALASAVQSCEEAALDLALSARLGGAAGRALDMIGALLGAPRGGLPDVDYHRWLRAHAVARVARGRPDRIIEAVRLAIASPQVTYRPVYPASFVIEIVPGATLDPEQEARLVRMVERAAPAGVLARVIKAEDGYFGFPRRP